MIQRVARSQPEFWSTLLYFLICREEQGDVLRVFVARRVCIWTLHGRFPDAIGQRQMATGLWDSPEGAVRRCAALPTWDDGVCHVGARGQDAARAFDWAYQSGRMNLALSGLRIRGVYELNRCAGDLWEIWPTARAERVA